MRFKVWWEGSDMGILLGPLTVMRENNFRGGHCWLVSVRGRIIWDGFRP